MVGGGKGSGGEGSVGRLGRLGGQRDARCQGHARPHRANSAIAPTVEQKLVAPFGAAARARSVEDVTRSLVCRTAVARNRFQGLQGGGAPAPAGSTAPCPAAKINTQVSDRAGPRPAAAPECGARVPMCQPGPAGDDMCSVFGFHLARKLSNAKITLNESGGRDGPRKGRGRGRAAPL